MCGGCAGDPNTVGATFRGTVSGPVSSGPVLSGTGTPPAAAKTPAAENAPAFCSAPSWAALSLLTGIRCSVRWFQIKGGRRMFV